VRVLAVCIAIAVVVFVVTGGRFVFLPLVFLPFGLFRFGGRRRNRRF
jgi:hypothetical protein